VSPSSRDDEIIAISKSVAGRQALSADLHLIEKERERSREREREREDLFSLRYERSERFMNV
jgi:hypothetical protein